MINQNYLSAEGIQQRMEEEALKVPSLIENSTTKGIIKYFSNEFAKQHAQIRLQKNDLYQQLLQRIFPEILGRALPSCGLAKITIDSLQEEIVQDESYYIKDTNLYLSPVTEVNLINGELSFLLTHNVGYQYQEGSRKILPSHPDQVVPPESIALGIRLKSGVENIDGMTISMKGISEDKLTSLEFVQIDSAKTQLDLGYGLLDNLAEATSFPDHEFFRLKSIRKEVLSTLGKTVFKVRMKEEGDINLLKKRSPEQEEYLLNHVERAELENVIWLEFYFPEPFTPEELAQLKIDINVVPMWNVRKDISSDQTATSNSMVIPLTKNNQAENDYFLGLLKAYSDSGSFIHSPLQNKLAHSYRIQECDLSKFESGSITRYIDDLTFMIEQQKNQIGLLKAEEYLLIHPLDSLSDSIKQIEDQIKNYREESSKSKDFYIHLFPRQIGEMIYIESLHTQGEQVSQRILPPHAQLEARNEQDFSFKEAFLLEAPIGGRVPLNIVEQESLVRSVLMAKIKF